MDREHVHSEIKALIDGWHTFQPVDAETLTDEITTRVMAEAAPGEVCQIEALAAQADGYACKFQTVYPNQLARIGFRNTVVIPAPVAAALAALAA